MNGLNQYTAAGTASFAYDHNGNLTQSSSTFYCYDTENRLVGSGASATDCSSLAVMTYDPLGRLVTTQASGTTTRLVYDGDDLVAEYNGATLLRRYLHGPGTDDPLVQYEGTTVASTAARLLYSDAQGSIIATTDNAGNLMLNGINKYDEYGIPQTDSSGHSLNSGRFQYTGQQWIPELGMYYYKARFYSPTLGRFMQTDPVGYKDQINLYAYVRDDPIDQEDPTGNESACAEKQGGDCGESGNIIKQAQDHPIVTAVSTGVFMAPLAVGAASALAAGAPEVAAGTTEAASVTGQNAGSHTVYTETVNGVVRYVGRTGRELSARAGEHLRETGRVIRPLITGLSKQAARGVEQAVIEARGLAKEGGTLANRINSIAQSNPIYEESVRLGRAILDELPF